MISASVALEANARALDAAARRSKVAFLEAKMLSLPRPLRDEIVEGTLGTKGSG